MALTRSSARGERDVRSRLGKSGPCRAGLGGGPSREKDKAGWRKKKGLGLEEIGESWACGWREWGAGWARIRERGKLFSFFFCLFFYFQTFFKSILKFV